MVAKEVAAAKAQSLVNLIALPPYTGVAKSGHKPVTSLTTVTTVTIVIRRLKCNIVLFCLVLQPFSPVPCKSHRKQNARVMTPGRIIVTSRKTGRLLVGG